MEQLQKQQRDPWEMAERAARFFGGLLFIIFVFVIVTSFVPQKTPTTGLDRRLVAVLFFFVTGLAYLCAAFALKRRQPAGAVTSLLVSVCMIGCVLWRMGAVVWGSTVHKPPETRGNLILLAAVAFLFGRIGQLSARCLTRRELGT